MKKKRLVYFGSPEFSLPPLKTLYLGGYDIVGIYTQEPKKKFRGQKKNFTPVQKWAESQLLSVFTPKVLNDDTLKEFQSLKPDVAILFAYGKIVPSSWLNTPLHGFINIHASLLPKWRGAAPIQRAIMNLDNQTGISIMKIVEELDAGPVMQQDKIQINENIDTLTLSKVLSKLGANSILNAIIKIEKGEARFQEQNHSEATYAKKISKMEGQINWKESAKKVLAKINGLNPNPGAWFEYNKERYKVWKAKIVNENSESGKIVDNKLTIACKEQSIKILEIQKEGKSRQPIDQFLIGNKIKQGEKII